MYNRDSAKASSGNSDIDRILSEVSQDCLGLRLRKLDRMVTQLCEKRLSRHGISLAQFIMNQEGHQNLTVIAWSVHAAMFPFGFHSCLGSADANAIIGGG